MAVAENHGLDGLGVDLEEAHVVHEPIGADAGVEEYGVLAALLGDGDERREPLLAPQLLDHLASFDSGRACSRQMLGSERKPPRRSLVRHEGISQVVDEDRNRRRVDRLERNHRGAPAEAVTRVGNGRIV